MTDAELKELCKRVMEGVARLVATEADLDEGQRARDALRTLTPKAE